MQKPKLNHLTSSNTSVNGASGSACSSSIMSSGSNGSNLNGSKLNANSSVSSNGGNGNSVVTTLTNSSKTFNLPESLEMIQKCEYFPTQRHRWNTNEEIASILIGFDRHSEWLSKEVKIRPKSGSLMLYSRKCVRYRRDGYCWKKRKDGKTTREDHMKLKVQGTECIYGCYVHSAILPTFHRRCYWLLQNPDIVLVHYLNVPFTDDNKIISPTLNYFADNKKEWTKDELISELKPMFFSENEPDINNELEISTAETIESIVTQLMTRQRAKVKALEEASDINARALTALAVASSSSSSSSSPNCSSASLNSSLNCATNTVVSTSAVVASNVHLVTSSNIANSTQFTSTTTAVNANSSLIPVSTAALTHHRILHPLSGSHHHHSHSHNQHQHQQHSTVNQPSDLLIKGQQQRSLATNLLGAARVGNSLGQNKNAPPSASASTVVALATAASGSSCNLNCNPLQAKNESQLDTSSTLLAKGTGLQLIKRASNSTAASTANATGVEFGHRGASSRGGLQLLQLTAPSATASNCKSAIALTSSSSHRVSPITSLVGSASTGAKSTAKSGSSPTSLIFNLSHLQSGSGILILPNLNSTTGNGNGTGGAVNGPSSSLSNCANGNIGHVTGATGNSATAPVTLLYSRNGNNNNQCTNGQVDSSSGATIVNSGTNSNVGHDGHIISQASSMKQQQQRSISMDITPATATTASSSSSSLCPDGESNNNNNGNDNPSSPSHCNGLNFTSNASMATSEQCDMEMSIDMDTSNLSHINISPPASSNDAATAAAVVTGRNMNLQSTSSINSSSPTTNETTNAIEADGDLVDVDPCDLSNYTGFTDSDSPNGNSPSGGSISRFAFDHNSPDSSDNSGQVSTVVASFAASTTATTALGHCLSHSLRQTGPMNSASTSSTSKSLFHHQRPGRSNCNFNGSQHSNEVSMRLDGLYHCTADGHHVGATQVTPSLGHGNKSQECNVSAKTVKDDANNCPMMDLTSGSGTVSAGGGGGGPATTGPPGAPPVVVDDDDHAMDFIENDLSPCDGDLFNLDTFDMLSEFSNLDDFTTSSNTTSSTFHFLMKSTTTHGNNGNKDALNGNINDDQVMASTTTQSTSTNSMMHPLAIGQSDSVNNNHQHQHHHQHQQQQHHHHQHQRSPTTTNCHGRHQLNNQHQQQQHQQQQHQQQQQPQSQLNCGSDSNNMQTSCHESMAQSSDFILTSNGGHTANNNHGHGDASASNSNCSLVDRVEINRSQSQLRHGQGENNSPNSMVDSTCNGGNNNNNSSISLGHSPCGTSNNNDSTSDTSTTVLHSQPQITDYSPEWSYPEGGMKVLVAGPWYSSAVNYSISFDGISVPTSLVQNGVLRCYSPAHEPGFVTLQVSIGGGNMVSNSVIFEYRDHPSTPSQCSEDYFSVDDNVLKFCLLERLELLESHVVNASNVPSSSSSSSSSSSNNNLSGTSSGIISSKLNNQVNYINNDNCNNHNDNDDDYANEDSVKSEINKLPKTINIAAMSMPMSMMMMMQPVQQIMPKMESGGKIIENKFEGCVQYECNVSQDSSQSHKYYCNSGNLSVPGINVCLSHVQSNCIGPNSSQSVGTSDTCNVNLMESDKSKENLLSETIYKCNITPNAFEKRFERLFESISHINNFNWSLNYFHPFVDQLNQLGSKNICQGRYSSLTILHLVSALGFIDLLKLLLNYTKCHRESLLVKGQLNTRSVDGQNCIPLMWSCARGHVDCSLVLAHLDPETVNLCNKEHLTPLELAIGNGHEQLARELFKLKVTQVAVRISLGEKCKETLQLPLVDGRRRRKNASLRGNSMDGKVYCTCSCFCRNNNNSSSNNKSVDDINCSSGKSGANNITSDAHGCTCDCCCISTCPPPCTLTGDGRRSTRRRRTRSNRTSSTSDATGDADATLTGTCTASATTAGKEVQVNANKCTNHTASEAIVFHATQHQQSNCNGLHTGYCQVAADSVTDSVATCLRKEVKIESQSKCNKDNAACTNSSGATRNGPNTHSYSITTSPKLQLDNGSSDKSFLSPPPPPPPCNSCNDAVTHDALFHSNNCCREEKNDEQVNDEGERSNPKANDDSLYDTFSSSSSIQKKCSLNQYKRVNGTAKAPVSTKFTAQAIQTPVHVTGHQVSTCQKSHPHHHLPPPLPSDFVLFKFKNEPLDASDDFLGNLNTFSPSSPVCRLHLGKKNSSKDDIDLADACDDGEDVDDADVDDEDANTDTTVLSFAENVIAAMPERIKQSDQSNDKSVPNKRRGVNLGINLAHSINKCNNSSDKSRFFSGQKSIENTQCHHVHHHHHHHHHHYHLLDDASKSKSNLNSKVKQSQISKNPDARVASSPQSSSTCTSSSFSSSSSSSPCSSSSCTSSELKLNCYNKLQQKILNSNRLVHCNCNSLDELTMSNLSENNLNYSNEPFTIASGATNSDGKLNSKFESKCQHKLTANSNTEKDNILSSQNNYSGCYGWNLMSPTVQMSHNATAMDTAATKVVTTGATNLASPASNKSTGLLQRTSSVDAGIESMASSLIDVASDTSVNSNPSSPLSASLFSSSSSSSSLSSLTSCGLDFATIFSPATSSTSSPSVDSIIINSPNSTDSLSEFFKSPKKSESFLIKNLKSQNNLNSVKRWHESNSKANDSYELFKSSYNSFKLSDDEQRELYSAAKVIQKAYRSYKEKCGQVPSQFKFNLNQSLFHHHHRHRSSFFSSSNSSSNTSNYLGHHCHSVNNHFNNTNNNSNNNSNKKCKSSLQNGELNLNLNCDCNDITTCSLSSKCTSNGDINYTLSNSITDSLLNHCNESIIKGNNNELSSSLKSSASKVTASASSTSASTTSPSASSSSKSNGTVKTLTIKESQAAILIQSYYRRYKQFVYYKQMTKAASIIQNQFRSYCSSKRHKKAKIN